MIAITGPGIYASRQTSVAEVSGWWPKEGGKKLSSLSTLRFRPSTRGSPGIQCCGTPLTHKIPGTRNYWSPHSSTRGPVGQSPCQFTGHSLMRPRRRRPRRPGSISGARHQQREERALRKGQRERSRSSVLRLTVPRTGVRNRALMVGCIAAKGVTRQAFAPLTAATKTAHPSRKATLGGRARSCERRIRVSIWLRRSWRP